MLRGVTGGAGTAERPVEPPVEGAGAREFEPGQDAAWRMVEFACAALAVCAIATFALLALLHLSDNYHVDHVAGAWMGLAYYADHGTFYPALFAHGYFGGTRYGPLGIALNALAGAGTGEYLSSGKFVALTEMSALLVGVYVLCRRLGSAQVMALCTVGAVVASFTTVFAGTTIYGDSLAAALQVWALVVATRAQTPRAAALTGFLCALAVTAKLSGVWAGLAVAVWFGLRDRRLLISFAVAALLVGWLVFAAAAFVSDGRMTTDLIGLTGSGVQSMHQLVIDTPSKIWELARQYAPGTLILGPFAVVAIAVAFARRRVTIVEIALALSAVVTLVVMTDFGTGFNHLLDLVILIPLAVAGWANAARPGVRHALIAVLGVAMLVSLFGLRRDVYDAGRSIVTLQSQAILRPPALDLRLAQPYFTEDPTVAVERGQRPVALDSFMLLRILRTHPAWRRQLVARFDRREFKAVVLITDLNVHDPWWSNNHLGLPVATAIARNYRLERTLLGPVFLYRIFVPRR